MPLNENKKYNSGVLESRRGRNQSKNLRRNQNSGSMNKSKSRSRSNNAKYKDMSFEMKMHEKMQAENYIEHTNLENKTGILIQALKELFDSINNDKDKTYFVKCSYVEIYNDQVYDLLQRSENFSETLQVCEDAEKKEFYIRGVKEEIIDDW